MTPGRTSFPQENFFSFFMLSTSGFAPHLFMKHWFPRLSTSIQKTTLKFFHNNNNKKKKKKNQFKKNWKKNFFQELLVGHNIPVQTFFGLPSLIPRVAHLFKRRPFPGWAPKFYLFVCFGNRSVSIDCPWQCTSYSLSFVIYCAASWPRPWLYVTFQWQKKEGGKAAWVTHGTMTQNPAKCPSSSMVPRCVTTFLFLSLSLKASSWPSNSGRPLHSLHQSWQGLTVGCMQPGIRWCMGFRS